MIARCATCGMRKHTLIPAAHFNETSRCCKDPCYLGELKSETFSKLLDTIA